MPDGPVLQAFSVVGSSSSDDGNHIFLGFKNANGEDFHIMLPHQVGIDMMLLNATAVGQAARNRTQDSTKKYAFPVENYSIGIPDPDGKFLINFVLPGGLELSFQFQRETGLRFYEGLGSALGVNTPTLPPGTRPN